MERTPVVCEGCGHAITGAYVDGDLQPVGQVSCPECGGTEFAAFDAGEREDGGHRGTG